MARMIGDSLAAADDEDVTVDPEADDDDGDSSPGADLLAAIDEGDSAKVDAALRRAIRVLK